MTFSIDPHIFAVYPDLQIGILACHNIQNEHTPDSGTSLLRQEEAILRERIQDPEKLKELPTIVAWQEAHRAFGSNPNKFMCSVHALAKRVVKGNDLPSINTLVDLYNVISLRHLFPVGGEDLDRCRGDIHLTISDGTEPFTPLGEESNDSPEAGEVIYRDDDGVICRKFNWREAARTCLTEQTTNAVLVIESIPPTTHEELSRALNELSSLVEEYCGGSAEMYILTVGNPVCNL